MLVIVLSVVLYVVLEVLVLMYMCIVFGCFVLLMRNRLGDVIVILWVCNLCMICLVC